GGRGCRGGHVGRHARGHLGGGRRRTRPRADPRDQQEQQRVATWLPGPVSPHRPDNTPLDSFLSYCTGTPCSVTGPVSGLSSVAWSRPAGVIVSITFGTVFGSTAQIGLFPPGAHTPKLNGCGVAANERAWSELNPSWPVRATVNTQPVPGSPNAARGSTRVAVL